jgi:uncharacterized protein (TIGR01777 family)
MKTFERRSLMPAPADEVFAWHARPGAFERLNPPYAPVEVEERTGGLEVGARTVIRLPIGPVKQRWVAEHTAYEAGRMFRDEQTSGPFAKWIHTHRCEPKDAHQSELIDSVEYELPLGGLGSLFGGPFTSHTLERMFTFRHAVLRNDLLRHAQFAGRPRLTVAVAGASGLIGSSLLAFLSTGGHTVRAVKRTGHDFDARALEGADVVVNLAGAGIADARWSDARKRELVDSRVGYTRRLLAALQQSGTRPRVWIQGSAVGVYGDRGDEELTEDSSPGRAGPRAAEYLAGLCRDWEAAGEEARALGARVVTLRTGIVQAAQGGALAKLLPAFKLGAGGPIAGGKGWQSWISLEDMLGLVLFAAYNESLSGPVNATAPHPVTSLEYAQVLGRVLSRPAFAPLPAFVLRTLFGELADGALLASQRAVPQRLTQAGFQFLFPGLEDALRFTLGR